MNKRKSRISVKVSMYIAVMQVIVMLCMFLFISFSVSENMKKTTINNMQTTSTDRAKLIEDYIRSSEEFLTAYGRAGEITDLLLAPADEEAVAAAQKYTETFSADSSTQSAEDIEKLVDDLVNNSNASIAETVRLNDILEKQEEELKLTIQGFDSLKKEVVLVADVSKSINGSTGRMKDQQSTLSGIVENLSAISEENAASCEETSATMESVSTDINICNEKVQALTELSENLKSQVSHFKL